MRILAALIDLYSLVVLISVIMSWVPTMRATPLAAVVDGLTEPVLEPIRRVLPAVSGLDFSPMILLVLLRVLRGAM